jgi:hypothetical protein
VLDASRKVCLCRYEKSFFYPLGYRRLLKEYLDSAQSGTRIEEVSVTQVSLISEMHVYFILIHNSFFCEGLCPESLMGLAGSNSPRRGRKPALHPVQLGAHSHRHRYAHLGHPAGEVSLSSCARRSHLKSHHRGHFYRPHCCNECIATC